MRSTGVTRSSRRISLLRGVVADRTPTGLCGTAGAGTRSRAPVALGEVIPGAVLDTVADQIGIDPVVFALYARRDETRREHLAEIMTRLDLRTMQERDYRFCIRAAATGAVATEQGGPIVLAVIDALKMARIVVPGPRLVERLALAGRARWRGDRHTGI